MKPADAVKPAGRPDLSTLTGVRSGKRSYYRAYVRSDERLRRSMRSMDSISQAIVRAREGPAELLVEVVRAAADHLDASWTVLALADGVVPDAQPRYLAISPDGRLVTDRSVVPPELHPSIEVPLLLDGEAVGWLVGAPGMADDPEPADPADLVVLRILANQAAMALHTFQQYRNGMALEQRAQQLYDEARTQQQRLDERTEELRRLGERLAIADQRELITQERHRIARELHDSVIQYVLSAGMTIEVARGENRSGAVDEALATAKRLCQDAVHQLRSAIYALHPDTDTELTSRLPDLIGKLAPTHEPRLPVEVRVEGQPVSMAVEAHHEIVQAVGEALFNVVCHASATRAVVTLRYRPGHLVVEVADDGAGRAAELAEHLTRARSNPTRGRGRGLVNIETRTTGLGGRVRFEPSPLGGVAVRMWFPLPVAGR